MEFFELIYLATVSIQMLSSPKTCGREFHRGAFGHRSWTRWAIRIENTTRFTPYTRSKLLRLTSSQSWVRAPTDDKQPHKPWRCGGAMDNHTFEQSAVSPSDTKLLLQSVPTLQNYVRLAVKMNKIAL